MVPLMDCPHCEGATGDEHCDCCGGYGQVSTDFAEKVGIGEHQVGSCDDCGAYGVCVLEARVDLDRLICSPCWIKSHHPHLWQGMEEERAAAYIQGLRRIAGDSSYPDMQRAAARVELDRLAAERAVSEVAA